MNVHRRSSSGKGLYHLKISIRRRRGRRQTIPKQLGIEFEALSPLRRVEREIAGIVEERLAAGARHHEREHIGVAARPAAHGVAVHAVLGIVQRLGRGKECLPGGRRLEAGLVEEILAIIGPSGITETGAK